MKPKLSSILRLFCGVLLFLLFSGAGYSQDRTVTGKVVNPKDKTGLAGASVQLKGTTKGTVTDVNGDFSIAVPSSGATLIFSYSGLGTQEIAVGNQTTINV